MLCKLRVICHCFFALAAFASGQAIAVGTAAGTLIHNMVEVSYVAPYTGVRYIHFAEDSFFISEIIRSDVTALDAAGVAAAQGDDAVPMAFSVTNTGNGEESFLLTAQPNSGDDFQPQPQSIYLESNGIPGWQSGDTELPYSTASVNLPADSTETVYVLSQIPSSITHENTGGLVLTATSQTPGANSAGPGDSVGVQAGVDQVVAQQDGKDSDEGFYVATALQLGVIKNIVSTVDPYGGEQPMAGSKVTYEIDVKINGQGVARQVEIKDPVPGKMYYQPNSMYVDGKLVSDAQDNDRAYFDGNEQTAHFVLGDVPSPSTFKLRVTYVIN